jgi:hypothetical protein
MLDKESLAWNEGYKKAIEQAMEVINRANIESQTKIVLRGRLKKLKRELGMTEKKLSMIDVLQEQRREIENG